AEKFRLRETEEAERGTIGVGYLTLVVEAEHARAHAREHGFGELAALVQLMVRLDQVVALALELARHPVERAGQHVEFVAGTANGHAGAQIADTDALGGADKLRDR